MSQRSTTYEPIAGRDVTLPTRQKTGDYRDRGLPLRHILIPL